MLSLRKLRPQKPWAAETLGRRIKNALKTSDEEKSFRLKYCALEKSALFEHLAQ
jgi:hypothetical protein